MSTFTSVVTYEPHICGKCGVAFALSLRFSQERQGDHQTWYCPNGHPRIFTGTSEADRLREQLEASRSLARRERERREATERSRAAVQGVATKRAKQLARVRNGVCPCCNRSFADLHRHMAGQHPEYHPGVV